MLIPLKVPKNPRFRGRDEEQARLAEIGRVGSAKIVVLYGRRRVGKTELIEQTLRQRKLLKFEGLERQSKSRQLANFAATLTGYLKEQVGSQFRFTSWIQAFQALARYVRKGKWTIYLEELQWLANYQNELISSFKHVWDNELRHNPNLLVVMCGSAPSFMISRVYRSSALYNRTEENFPVRPLLLPAVRKFFGSRYAAFEVMDAMLTVGAIPPYLEKLKEAPSILIGLARNSFKRDAYFVAEYDRIFTSNMADNPAYRRAVEFLAKKRFASKLEIGRALDYAPGGGLTAILTDLEQTGFISSYSPLDKSPDSKLKRYHIADPYINFYLHFIRPIQGRIMRGAYDRNPERAINSGDWRIWMGFNFERWIRANAVVIARILGFEGIEYDAGAFFSRASPKTQIDLVFERADRVTTIVETKYTREPIGAEIIPEFDKKCRLYPVKGRSVRRVLVSAAGVTPTLIKRDYFDRIITLNELMEPAVWK